MKRWILGLTVILVLWPLAAEAEVVALQLERKGVKKPEQMVYGRNLASGQVVWEHRFGEEVNFVEKVKEGWLVGCDDGSLNLLDAITGALRWTAKLGDMGDKVNTFRGEFSNGYLVSYDDDVLWFVSRKGELLWVWR